MCAAIGHEVISPSPSLTWAALSLHSCRNYLLNSEKTYSDAALSLLPAPTTCTYTVDGPWASVRLLRFSLVFTRRSGSFCRAFFQPGGCLVSGLWFVAIVRKKWKKVRCERNSQRAAAGGAAERDLPLTSRNVKDLSCRRTVFIIKHVPQWLKQPARVNYM